MKSLTYIEVDVDDFADTTSPIAQTTFRFAMPTDYLPKTIDAIPSIGDVSFTPATISLGQNLGERATLTVSFIDHRHIFNGESFDSGTFWGKWRARYGQKLRGRSVRWIQGLLGQSLAEMETRSFVIDSTDGPTPDGIYTIVAKDVLKLADDDRSQAPALSNGFIVANITDTDTTATLSPTGIGNAEYPASGYVAIGGKEICAFTRSGDVLTFEEGSPPTSTRGQLGTTAVSHEAGDRVQLVLRYVGEDPADIISDLLQAYAGVPSAYIPLSAWQTETGSFLQRLYTATIAEPTGVNKLISELVEQAALALWWEPSTEQIRLQVLRSIPTTAAIFDQDNTVEGSLSSKEQPDTRISEVWTYFGLRNPCEPVDRSDNYRSVAITADLEAETDYGSAAIKKIFSRWIPFGGRSVATRLNDIQLGKFKDPPRRFSFSTWRYAEDAPMLGGGYRLKSWTIQDVTGAASDAPIQITRLNPTPDSFEIEAEEVLFESLDPADLVDRVIIIDSNINNINLRDIHDSIYPDVTGSESPEVTITFIVSEGVIVGSSSIDLPACDAGSWPVGVVPTIQILGRIQGKGGNGAGNGQVNGQNGGPALHTRANINLDIDAGEIWGGGGGGGCNTNEHGTVEAGGGGGAGQLPGTGGDDGTSGHPGGNGTTEAGGIATGGGGNGGGPGQNGTASSTSGGTAGTAIDGVSFVTVTEGPGDIRGSEIN